MVDKLELLAPAGSLETLKAVINAGADAVYVGGSMFGARAYANNFDQEELIEAIEYGHIHGRKVIMAVNTLLKDRELTDHLYDYLLPFYEAGVDAVIVQDMGVFRFVRDNFPDLPIHTSTQMTMTGVYGAAYLKSLGASRVVTAREMSLADIAEIHKKVDIEIESFCHGALCYCYSGQCLLSSIIGGRSGNRGRCAQPCRLPYTVYDQGRCISEKETGMLSLKDMNTIAFLPELAESGVFSFKIEGRMKSPEYAAGVVSIYRKYMDRYLACGKEGYQVSPADQQMLLDLGNRNGFTDGYYYKHNDTSMLTGKQSNHSKSDGTLQAKVAKQYINCEIKEKINGILKLHKDTDAMMQVSYAGKVVTVTGEPVQAAQKRPLTKETVAEKIGKTGSTPFEFEQLTIEMDDDIFLPVNQLNSIRRDALEQLRQELLANQRRTQTVPKQIFAYPTPDKDSKVSSRYKDVSSENPCLVVSVENRDCLQAAMKASYVAAIYLDSILYPHATMMDELAEDVLKIKSAGKEVYFIMPSVFRKRTTDFYETIAASLVDCGLDGYVVKDYDEIGFLKKYAGDDVTLISDHNVYSFSNEAHTSLMEQGILRDTVPVELNKKELLHRDNTESEMLIYGYLPLMVSAGCVHKNTAGCDKTTTLLQLKDRYGVEFPVKNYCSECYNIVYNAKPLFLMHLSDELTRLTPKAWRIHFSLEDHEEAVNVLAAFEQAFIRHKTIRPEECVSDYTNGHYKRGVE